MFNIGTKLMSLLLQLSYFYFGLTMFLSLDSDDLKPMVKYVGNIHGNEAVGKELLIHFAKYLLQSYSSPSSNADFEAIKKLIDTTDIHILPSMNPDGFEHSMTKDCSGVTGF